MGEIVLPEELCGILKTVFDTTRADVLGTTVTVFDLIGVDLLGCVALSRYRGGGCVGLFRYRVVVLT